MPKGRPGGIGKRLRQDLQAVKIPQILSKKKGFSYLKFLITAVQISDFMKDAIHIERYLEQQWHCFPESHYL
jgi:hypothetical protein